MWRGPGLDVLPDYASPLSGPPRSISPRLPQPPFDEGMYNASLCHYTWGVLYHEAPPSKGGKQIYRWEKRDFNGIKHVIKVRGGLAGVGGGGRGGGKQIYWCRRSAILPLHIPHTLCLSFRSPNDCPCRPRTATVSSSSSTPRSTSRGTSSTCCTSHRCVCI